MSDEKISTELDYKKGSYSHPSYRLQKIMQQTGSQDVPLTTGGGQVSVFELPTQVYNLSKSSLYFTMTPSAPGQMAGPLDLYNYIFKDCVAPISRLSLYTRGGMYLCDIPYLANYTKVVNKAETPLTEYLDYNQGHALNDGTTQFLHKNNSLANCTATSLLEPYAKRPDSSACDIHYTEPQYLEPGITGNAAITPTLTVCMPLGHIKNSILACDKDLYFGEVIILRVEWAPSIKCGFRGSSVTVPTTNPTAIAGNVDIGNLALYLSVEKDQDIINGLQSKVNSSSGFQMLMPYVHGYKSNSGAGSTSVSLRFNRGHGDRLLKVYYAPFNNDETTNTTYDHSNVGGAKISNYYTMLNNSRLQEFNVVVSPTVNEDYVLNKDLLEKSVIQSSNMYRYNWFHVDNFSGLDLKDGQKAFTHTVGLPLEIEQKWDIYNTTAVAVNNYCFAVCQRTLKISSAGIEVQSISGLST